MTFEQLRYFVAAAEEKTFFDAAESLHTTQPTLSKQIMNLEKELGLKLLDRSKRKATLTDSGEEFYKEALILLRQYEKMQKNMQKFKDRSEQTLRIGALPILMQYGLDDSLQEFSKIHPEISLQLDEAEETELLNRLEDDSYHMIIARSALVSGSAWQRYPLAYDELIAVFPDSHPLAVAFQKEPEPIPLSRLSGERFILMHRYTSVYRQCMEEFRKYEINADILRNARVESILSAVLMGEGISLMPKSNLEVFHRPHIIGIPLSPPVPMTVVLARKKGTPLTDAMREFIGFVRGDRAKRP